MPTLFDRYVEIRAGLPGETGTSWTSVDGGLQITFDISKTSRRSSNKATVTMTNLSPRSVGVLEQAGAVVQIIAGYKGRFALLFTGDVAKQGVSTDFESVDKITTIEAGDAELAMRQTRSDISYGPGASTREILAALADTMGVGAGNLDNVEELVYLSGFVHLGLARDAIDQVTADVGVEWSIQAGVLQFLRPGETLKQTAFLITPRTGLIGAPVRTQDGLEAKSLLLSDAEPGRLAKVESAHVNGFYKIREVNQAGDSRGNDFYTTLKGKKVDGQ